MVVVVAASLATAAGVAAGGIIGFVGLVSPHVARLLVGARHCAARFQPAPFWEPSCSCSPTTLRTIAAPNELPVGVMTALLGSPFFLALLNIQGRQMAAPP